MEELRREEPGGPVGRGILGRLGQAEDVTWLLRGRAWSPPQAFPLNRQCEAVLGVEIGASCGGLYSNIENLLVGFVMSLLRQYIMLIWFLGGAFRKAQGHRLGRNITTGTGCFENRRGEDGDDG